MGGDETSLLAISKTFYWMVASLYEKGNLYSLEKRMST
jgi:hypothetical protein